MKDKKILLHKIIQDCIKRKIPSFLYSKKAIGMDYLIWLIIGLTVLVLSIITLMILKDRGVNILEFIKNILRFGKSLRFVK